MHKIFRNISLTIAATSALMLSGCYMSTLKSRTDLAKGIAGAKWMIERQIAADPFVLTAFERIHERGGQANIYIEGDGQAWISKRSPSLNPTPKDPIALRLASQDTSQNVFYLARPCQYTLMLDQETICSQDYWMGKRFAPEVLKSFNAALNDIATRYDINGFNIIGFSGGGTVATILAGQRNDILSLRTVAGNIDHVAHSKHHNVSYLTESLNTSAYTRQLAQIPQHHFIGEDDQIVPPIIFKSYVASLPSQRCVSHTIVADTKHADDKWTENWASLLKEKPRCR